MFDLPTSVTVSGCEYPIRTDFRVILEIFVMLDDPDLTDADKTEALLRMVAPINHILGFECRSVDFLHWHTFLAAYLEIPPESVFARVLRIREKLRTGKKLEKYERTWYNKNRDLVHLRPKFSKAEKKLIEAWT